MKVVVLDDEEKVCNLICALIDWNGLGLTLAGTASDGPSGLALIKETYPDLLITDIRMPGMDGLQLIAEAKKVLPDLQVIIISGYSQFDYAQTAIRCGVVNYLLKPVKQQELNATLRRMAEEYSSRQTEMTRAKQLEEQVRRTAVQKQKLALLSACLNKDSPASSDLALPFPSRVYVIQFDAHNPPYDMQAGSVLADNLESFLDETVTEPHVFVFNGTYCLFAAGGETEKDVYAQKVLAWCKAQTEIFRNFTLTIGCGGLCRDADGYYGSARLAFAGIQKRLTDGTLNMYEESSVPAPAGFDYSPYIKMLFAAVMQDDRQKYAAAYDAFRASLVSAVPEVCRYAPVLIDFGRSVIEEAVLHLGSTAGEQTAGLITMIETSPSCEQLWENVFRFLDAVYESVSAANRDKYAKPVREALHYIAEHYSDSQLSLNTVADYVELNSTYFSGLFKKSCGTGFAEYLQNIRLENAKNLLVKTKDPIKQIASDVGYADPKHFAKVFKSVTGIKPNEYRQLYE